MGSDDGSMQNSKVETPSENAESPTEIEQKIIKQIEYYFGDYNLCRDKFLKEQIRLDDGWIPLETLVKFNRLKSISTDFDQIVTALRKSPNKLMEINDDASKVRRTPDKPLPENGDLESKLKERCVYVKKFPEETTLDELQEYFQTYGTIENIQMRRFYSSKKFRGSVFVTFASKEEVEKFLNLTSVKYKGTDLSREMREAYYKRKEHQFKKAKELKEKKQRAKEELEEEFANEKEEIPKGCILKLSNLPEDLKWETLKAFFNEFSTVAYVDCQKGQTEATLRFAEENGAKLALEKASASNEENKLIINGKDVSARIVEGEEEQAYWKELQELRAKNKHRFALRGKKGKRKAQDENKNKESHKKKEDESETPAEKKQKTEA